MNWLKYFQTKSFKKWAALLVLPVALTFAYTRPATHKPITIGVFVSKSGVDAKYGENVEHGVILAVEEANRKNGERKIRVLSVDTDGKKELVEDAVKNFAADESVIAVIGEVSSERSNWAAKVAQALHIPMVSPAATNPSVTEAGPFVFRACYIDPFQGLAMAKFAFDDLGLRRVAILRHDRSNYGLGLAEYFIDRFRKLGGQIVAEETYSTVEGTVQIKDALEGLQNSKAQAIFLPAYYTEAAILSRELRKAKIKAIFLGGDGWDSPELYHLAGNDVTGSYFTTHFSPEVISPMATRFVSTYKKKFHAVPDGTAATGYDAAQMILTSLDRAANMKKPVTRDALRQKLSEIEHMNGVSGDITIDENRNAVKSVVILRVEKNQFHYVKTIEPAK